MVYILVHYSRSREARYESLINITNSRRIDTRWNKAGIGRWVAIKIAATQAWAGRLEGRGAGSFPGAIEKPTPGKSPSGSVAGGAPLAGARLAFRRCRLESRRPRISDGGSVPGIPGSYSPPALLPLRRRRRVPESVLELEKSRHLPGRSSGYRYLQSGRLAARRLVDSSQRRILREGSLLSLPGPEMDGARGRTARDEDAHFEPLHRRAVGPRRRLLGDTLRLRFFGLDRLRLGLGLVPGGSPIIPD